MLPIALDMQIEESASKHKLEIAKAFADLRARLLPPPMPPRQDQQRAYMLALQNDLNRYYRDQLRPCYRNPYGANALAANQAESSGGLYGLSGRLFGPLGF